MGRDTVSDKNIKSTFSLELHPGYIFKTNPFVKGENTKNKALNEMFSAHLKYSYSINNKVYNKVFPGVYQIGRAHV